MAGVAVLLSLGSQPVLATPYLMFKNTVPGEILPFFSTTGDAADSQQVPGGFCADTGSSSGFSCSVYVNKIAGVLVPSIDIPDWTGHPEYFYYIGEQGLAGDPNQHVSNYLKITAALTDPNLASGRDVVFTFWSNVNGDPTNDLCSGMQNGNLLNNTVFGCFTTETGEKQQLFTIFIFNEPLDVFFSSGVPPTIAPPPGGGGGTSVPEPDTIALLALSLIAAAGVRHAARWRARQPA
jgi:hypothetical protein